MDEPETTSAIRLQRPARGDVLAALDELPLDELPLTAALYGALTLRGARTLGDARRLPRRDIPRDRLQELHSLLESCGLTFGSRPTRPR
jgi:hypothetical protein